MQLIIVESPKKAKTIENFLDGKIKVMGSGGHVRGLPEKRFGVDFEHNFEPTYVIEPDKKKTVEELKKVAAKADLVYLASDPDREGEAIAWHLYEVLDIKGKTHRIKFNEISEKAVKNALNNPERIDMDLVNSQQARRILDRIVGYKLSPFIRGRIKDSESAGRVQSVAVRLIVELERKIQSFVEEEYWNIYSTLSTNGKDKFKMLLSDKLGKKYKPQNEAEAEAVVNYLKEQDFIVKDVKKGVSKSHALPPFTTSTMQQDASGKLGMSAPQVMQLAQHLYEGVETPNGHLALVTYIRTDSTRISEDAQKDALAFIEKNFGKEYVPTKPNVYSANKNAQDAHEAIRPIDINITPDKVKNILDKNHYNLYKIIYERYLASQMAEAQYNSMQVVVNAGDYNFKASGKSVLFKGYTAVYDFVLNKTDDEGDAGKLLPDMSVGQLLNLIKLDKEQKFTKPPVRYTDSSLVKTMEENGIGRPSTYATIIGTLTNRKYIVRKGKYLVPTEIAFGATDVLVKFFPDIVNVGFTAKMEDKLDGIAEGDSDWHEVIGEFYTPFIDELKKAQADNGEETDIPCDKCGALMWKKSGRFGEYLYCKDCKFTKNLGDQITDKTCPNCGANMIFKDGKFGKYLLCSNEDCKSKMQEDEVVIDEKCESCGGVLVEKNGKFGKYFKCIKCGNTKSVVEEKGVCPLCHKPTQKRITKKGGVFFGCTGYPLCKFMSWDEPTGEMCPTCGKHLVIVNGVIKCSDKECKYNKSEASENNKDIK